MPAPSRAHLLLPSPQGLVHYDLLEEAAFLGPTTRGGLTAAPLPFREAKVALTDDGSGYVVRALPGEAPPDVNGAAASGARLRDGDRIRLGDQVALFRAPGATLPPAPRRADPPRAAPPPAPPRERRAAAAVPVVPAGARQGARVLAILGGLILLVAAYRAVQLLQTKGAAPVSPVTTAMTTPREIVVPRVEEQAAKALAQARAYERDTPADLQGAVSRYLALARAQPPTAASLAAAADAERLHGRLADQTWKDLLPRVEAETRSGKYRRALESLDAFEARFGATPLAAQAQAQRETIRAAARAALDGLRQRVAPLLASDATRAYRMLSTVGFELPPDLEAELAGLMARVREAWGPATPPTRDPPPGRVPTEPGRKPGFQPLPTPPDDGGPSGPSPAASAADAQARALWATALEHLRASRWADAKQGFATLQKAHREAACVIAHPDRLKACRLAADAGLRGPAALLAGEAEGKDGRLEVEYRFEDAKAFERDFLVDQPFPGEATAQAEVREGLAILSGATAMMLKVVFDPSEVAWEMDGVADEPRDWGLVGFQEGQAYRAVAMHVGNTQFKLKKGSAATVLPGHVLWLFGDGVWRAADPGERGFVRIAVENSNRLKGGERTLVRCAIRDGKIEGDISAKSDKVHLQGALKGDDGKGIGPLRVGAFAYLGRVGVERFQVAGKVDATWWKGQLEALLAAALGPD